MNLEESEFRDWQERLVIALESAGLPRRQAEKFGEGGVYESDALDHFDKQWTVHQAVEYELLGCL